MIHRGILVDTVNENLSDELNTSVETAAADVAERRSAFQSRFNSAARSKRPRHDCHIRPDRRLVSEEFLERHFVIDDHDAVIDIDTDHEARRQIVGHEASGW